MPTGYCLNYPVLSYFNLVVLRSEQTDNFINVSLDTNETEVILGNRDELKDDQKYVYRLNAFNSIGKITSQTAQK